MTRGFDANVPARKPRTKLSRVIADLTSGSVAGADDGKGPNGAPDLTLTAPAPDEAAAAKPQRQNPRGPSRGAGGQERIARLRERLAVTAHVPAGAAEPRQTAAAVRDLIEALRARLEAAIEERARLAGELDEARGALARGEAELQKERRARAALEAQAEERRRIADDAVAEAEALAAERDQVLEEVAELHRREDQAALLQEAEAALADLETRLQEALAGRSRAEARCRELETEVTRLSAAGEALEALETLMRRPR